MLRECVKFIKENEKGWKIEAEDRLTERQKKEIKNKQKQAANTKEKKLKEKETQKKISETWRRIPEHEQRNLIKEEEKRRLWELREVKVNIWKKWRKETVEKKKENEAKNKTKQEEWLEKLEQTLERMRREVEDRKKAKLLSEERRQKLLQEEKIRQEAMLKAEHEKQERKSKQRMLKERWEMARWIASYIDENSDRWKREKESRDLDEKRKAEEWKKMERLDKVRIIKEKMKENKTVTLKIIPSKLARKVPAPGDASQRECPSPPPPSDAMAQEDQALGDAQASAIADDVPAPGDAPHREDPPAPANVPHSAGDALQEVPHSADVPHSAADDQQDASEVPPGAPGDVHHHTDQQDDPGDATFAQSSQHADPGDAETCKGPPHHTLQPLTIMRAGPRYNEFQDIANPVQTLTSLYTGIPHHHEMQDEAPGDAQGAPHRGADAGDATAPHCCLDARRDNTDADGCTSDTVHTCPAPHPPLKSQEKPSKIAKPIITDVWTSDQVHLELKTKNHTLDK